MRRFTGTPTGEYYKFNAKIMGKYMQVVLKPPYRRELYINELNLELSNRYGGNVGCTFMSWSQAEEELDYLNNDPEGRKNGPGLSRPISFAYLQEHCFWLRVGEFHFKLDSSENTADAARDAVAVCAWLVATKGKYIDRSTSRNYRPKLLRQYLDDVFREDGYDLDSLWAFAPMAGRARPPKRRRSG